MLTNNFYQAVRAALSNTKLNAVVTNYMGSTYGIVASHTNVSNIIQNFTAEIPITIQSNPFYTPGFAFGTGTAQPSLNDYWLSGDVITTVKIVTATRSSEISDGVMRVRIVMTLHNTSTTDTVVINEMGVISTLFVAANSTQYCLTDRTVFDAPLTLAPEEQGAVTYTFTLPIGQ